MVTRLIRTALTAIILAIAPNISDVRAEQPGDFTQSQTKHIRIAQQEVAILNEYISCATNSKDEQGLRICGERKHLKLKELKLDEKERPRDH